MVMPCTRVDHELMVQGEMWGMEEVLRRIESGSRGGGKNLVLGVDNRVVLKCLKKGRGMCGKA